MAHKEGILSELLSAAKRSRTKLLAVLIDPDKQGANLSAFAAQCQADGVDVFLIGGSLMMDDGKSDCIATIRATSSLPIYLFPASPAQIDKRADGILFLSLISGRNPELLIGKQVEAAPILARTDLHVMSTGYMLVDCGKTTTAHYMSQTPAIPYNKPEIAKATALAGSFLGLSALYMDGGSGAQQTVSTDMIAAVARSVDIPLVLGGGIRTADDASRVCKAGADMIVVGNALETNPELLQAISIAVHATLHD